MNSHAENLYIKQSNIVNQLEDVLLAYNMYMKRLDILYQNGEPVYNTHEYFTAQSERSNLIRRLEREKEILYDLEVLAYH